MIDSKLSNRLNELVSALNAEVRKEYAANGWTREPDKVRWRERKKFVAIDIGTSGTWLVEKETGELYNIKGYGVPDYNKKQKANIGNVYEVDPAFLFSKRYNYLR